MTKVFTKSSQKKDKNKETYGNASCHNQLQSQSSPGGPGDTAGVEGEGNGFHCVCYRELSCVLVLVYTCMCDRVHSCMDTYTCMYSAAHSCGFVVDGRDAMAAF